ncbi:SH3 domain-containing protein [Bacillus sp. REN10]|uniref:SH3 domain-containing protein n=1 Tax=Bacillus sp. REN10 TaxID=2782541 RepID=UPI00193C1AE5|nr:SH3 domain-containing protein [Bacillus sp. REN10]
MKRVLLFIVAFLLLSIPTFVHQASASTGKHIVNVDTTLNVREKPSQKAKVVGSLKKNTVVYVYGTEPGGWSKIKYKNKAAYVASRYLKPAKGTAPSKKVWDGKWKNQFGTVSITNETADQFNFHVFVVMGGHVGEIDGTAKIKGNKATYSADTGSSFYDDPYCRMTFTNNGKSIQVKESSACLDWHGVAATFDGKYFK